MHQAGDSVRWQSAATSNDRDGMLARIDGAEGALVFRLQDPHLGQLEVAAPLDVLRRGRILPLARAGREAVYAQLPQADGHRRCF